MAMQNRILGRTGVSVSPLCLGAMMFASRTTAAVTRALVGPAAGWMFPAGIRSWT